MVETRLAKLFRFFHPEFTRRDVLVSKQVDWKGINAPIGAEADKYRLVAWLRRARRASPDIVDFAERVLEKSRTGQIHPNIVFLGRNSSPIFHAARILALKYGVSPDRVKLVDFPSELRRTSSPESAYAYLSQEGVLKSSGLTFVDDGSTGGLPNFLRKVFASQKGAPSFSVYLMASLKRRDPSWLREEPRRIASIVRALQFLGNQPHGRTRPSLTTDNKKKVVRQNPTSRLEQFAERQVLLCCVNFRS